MKTSYEKHVEENSTIYSKQSTKIFLILFAIISFLNIWIICFGFISSPIHIVNVMFHLLMTTVLLKDWFSFKKFPYDRIKRRLELWIKL